MPLNSSAAAAPSPSPFFNRKSGARFSGRYSTATTPRVRKNALLSFKSTRRTNPRTQRTLTIFEHLIPALKDGCQALKEYVVSTKTELPEPESSLWMSRMNYYNDLDKHTKAVERWLRVMEVNIDKIEDLQDEYSKKIKLRDGAFNLSIALASQQSKAAKEQLQVARAEQKDLLEDLCDIEDELDTKLGIFRVHINGLVGFSRLCNGDVFEVQLKLSNQKWKARCRVERQQQIWQDNDIVFIGRIMDELTIKVVEVKKIQADVTIGSAKCRTRELLTFFPQNCTVAFQGSSSVRLNMSVRWCPAIEDDFLIDVPLKPYNVVIGGAKSKYKKQSSISSVHKNPGILSRSNSVASVSREGYTEEGVYEDGVVTNGNHYSTTGLASAGSSMSSIETAIVTRTVAVEQPSKNKKNKRNSTHLGSDKYLKSCAMDFQYIEVSGNGNGNAFPVVNSNTEHHNDSNETTAGNLSAVTEEESISVTSSSDDSSSQPITLSMAVDNVMIALEEPREQFPELHGLESQLHRLEAALKGGKLFRTESITLSESQALGSFEFLEASLSPRQSTSSPDHQPMEKRVSVLSNTSEVLRASSPQLCLTHWRSESTELREAMTEELPVIDKAHDKLLLPLATSLTEDSALGSDQESCISTTATTGVACVDKALIQHLIYCEYLLQHLDSIGPFTFKMMNGIRKLRREADIILELLNMASEPYLPINIEEVLPELTSNDHLMSFWKSITTHEDMLSVTCEEYALALDKQFGAKVWSECPDVANKVYSTLLSRMLGLEGEVGDPTDFKMCVTVFHYSNFFINEAGGSIVKCLRDLMDEMILTETLLSPNPDVQSHELAKLLEGSFNQGALGPVSMLLQSADPKCSEAAVSYLGKFTDGAWHDKAVSYYREKLEHTDQSVRIGACLAMGKLKAFEAVQPLRYLMRVDFDPVKDAAKQALNDLDALSDGVQVMDIVNYSSSPYAGRVKLATSRLSQVNLEDGELQTEAGGVTLTAETSSQVMTRSESSISSASNPTTCI